jgi:hypothetical protein
VYHRFVRETIAAIKKSDISGFHNHLNAQNSNIQFTKERYKDTDLPFLDMLNDVDPDGPITTAVYRKATHSDRYLPFLRTDISHHPVQHNRSVVKAS